MDLMRRIIFFTLKVLISAALLYLALRKVNFADLAARLNMRSVAWIISAVGSLLASIIVGALRWRDVSAACGAPLSTEEALRYTLIGSFFNQVLPSSIGGDAVRLWLVGRKAGWQGATYSVLVDRVIGIVALTALIIVSLPWSYHLIADPQGRTALLIVDLIALTAGAGFLLMSQLSWLRWISPSLWQRWSASHLYACSSVTNQTVFSRTSGPRIAVLSLLVHILAVTAAWCVSRAITASASFIDFFLLIPPVTLITTLPISIAGWGVRETAMGLAFGSAGLAVAEGIQVSLLFGIVYFIIGGIGGLVWIFRAEKADKINPR